MNSTPQAIKVGDAFEKIAATFGFQKTKGCGCCDAQASMNAHGPKLVRQMPEPFIQAIKNELHARGFAIPDAIIRQALLTACYISENPNSIASYIFDRTPKSS